MIPWSGDSRVEYAATHPRTGIASPGGPGLIQYKRSIIQAKIRKRVIIVFRRYHIKSCRIILVPIFSQYPILISFNSLNPYLIHEPGEIRWAPTPQPIINICQTCPLCRNIGYSKSHWHTIHIYHYRFCTVI